MDEAAECGAEVWPAASAIEDALSSIAHLCDRFGLPPAETFKDALRRYRQDLEGDYRAAQIADGLHTTLKEIQCLATGISN